MEETLEEYMEYFIEKTINKMIINGYLYIDKETNEITVADIF